MNSNLAGFTLGFEKDEQKQIFQPGRKVSATTPSYSFGVSEKKLILQIGGKKDSDFTAIRFF